MNEQEKLYGYVFTTCDMLETCRLGGVERVLDDSPIAVVSRIGADDPPRTKTQRFEGGFIRIVEAGKAGQVVWIFTGGRRTGYCFNMTLTLQRKVVRIPLSGFDQGFSDVSYSIGARKLTDSLLGEAKRLFTGIADCVDAFYGRSGFASMYVQRNEFMKKSGPLLGARLFPDFNRELPDVYWLNYFGPGYVEHWGKDKVDTLGAEYELCWSAKGGVCVVTTPRPISADPDVMGITDYPFKKHFYHILGGNTFVHETQKPGQAGQYVPTLEDHRRALPGQSRKPNES